MPFIGLLYELSGHLKGEAAKGTSYMLKKKKLKRKRFRKGEKKKGKTNYSNNTETLSNSKENYEKK